jgi:hypothetical protein
MSSRRSLRSNINPHTDKGKDKETETADVKQLKDSSGEVSSPPTNYGVQQTTTTTEGSKQIKRHLAGRRRPQRASSNLLTRSIPTDGSIAQTQDLNTGQTNDSQESQRQGMMIHFGNVVRC